MAEGYAMAPKETISRKLPICYMYREEPDNMYDSGWRFFAGCETDEYVNDPDNIGIYDLSTIESIYPYLSYFLSLPAGTALERKNSDANFYLVHCTD